MKGVFVLAGVFFLIFFMQGVFASPQEKVINLSNQFIISKVGEDYFQKYFSYNQTIFTENLYVNESKVLYNYVISVENYSQVFSVYVLLEYVRGFFDETGNFVIVENWRIKGSQGIYDCISSKKRCMPFKINQEKALESARNNGYLMGVKKYEISLYDYGQKNYSYVWRLNVYESPEKVRSLFIDLHSARIIEAYKTNLPEGSFVYDDLEDISFFGSIPDKIYLALLFIVLFDLIFIVYKLVRKGMNLENKKEEREEETPKIKL